VFRSPASVNNVVICNYLALTSPTLLSQIWERRELETFLAPFSQVWEKGWG